MFWVTMVVIAAVQFLILWALKTLQDKTDGVSKIAPFMLGLVLGAVFIAADLFLFGIHIL